MKIKLLAFISMQVVIFGATPAFAEEHWVAWAMLNGTSHVLPATSTYEGCVQQMAKAVVDLKALSDAIEPKVKNAYLALVHMRQNPNIDIDKQPIIQSEWETLREQELAFKRMKFVWETGGICRRM